MLCSTSFPRAAGVLPCSCCRADWADVGRMWGGGWLQLVFFSDLGCLAPPACERARCWMPCGRGPACSRPAPWTSCSAWRTRKSSPRPAPTTFSSRFASRRIHKGSLTHRHHLTWIVLSFSVSSTSGLWQGGGARAKVPPHGILAAPLRLCQPFCSSRASAQRRRGLILLDFGCCGTLNPPPLPRLSHILILK